GARPSWQSCRFGTLPANPEAARRFPAESWPRTGTDAPGERGSDWATASLQQAPLHDFAGAVKLRLPRNLRLPRREAIAQLLQGVARHVRALVARARDAGHWVIPVLREFGLQLPKHVGFGGDQKVHRRLEAADIAEHSLG